VSHIEVHLPSRPERVFQVLEDPRSLRILVPGAHTIRRFDPDWPAVGSSVHHSVGLPPLVVRDTTQVIRCQPPRLLVLDARVHLLGRFTVQFQLTPSGAGTHLVVREEPVAGVASLPRLRPAVELALSLRNLELGRRMRAVLEQRAEVLGHALNGEAEHA
jgi:uncharacterized protein YndB with AHSA1/START domain